MIFDTIDNYKNYKGLGRVYEALEFIAKTDFSSIELGRHELDGDNIFYNVQELQTREDAYLSESHKKYIDIQFMIKGEELMGYAPISSEKKVVTENPDGDCFLYECKTEDFVLSDGKFAVFYPADIHRPCKAVGAPCKCHKVVVKVKVD